MNPIPWSDPQFWLVTLGALVAFLFILRRMIRVRKKGEIQLPCESCPQGGASGRIPQLVRRWSTRGASGGGPHGDGKRGGTAALGLAWLLFATAAQAEVVERQLLAMGTTLTLRVEGAERAVALAASETMIAAVADAERRLSTWRGDSEISRFNDGGEPVTFAPATAAALEVAIDCWRESGGAFDPTLAPLVEAWGLRQGGRVPSASEIERARAAVDAAALLGPDGHLLQARPPGVRGARIEEGGFGKGAALDEALALARSSAPGAALHLDLGGQLAWSGQTNRVVVRISDPRAREREVLELVLPAPRGSISTSGNSERGIVVDGVRLGHLLDPRTGRPAPDFGSATVFDPSATRADCLSTALFVLGPERGRHWLAEPGAEREGVLLTIDGEGLRAVITAGLAVTARALVPGIEIEVLSSKS